jgi:hypothetical protein
VDSRHVASWFQLESENPMKANSKTVLTVDEKNTRVNPHQDGCHVVAVET